MRSRNFLRTEQHCSEPLPSFKALPAALLEERAVEKDMLLRCALNVTGKEKLFGIRASHIFLAHVSLSASACAQ